MNHFYLKIVAVNLCFLWGILCLNGQESLSVEEQLDLAVQMLNEGAKKEEIPVNLKALLFEENNTEFNQEQVNYLSKMATYLKRTGFLVEIKAHSDKDESVKFNTKLAEERANKVQEFLVKNGVAAAKIEVNAYSDTKPLSVAPDQKHKNRRVEFQLSQNTLDAELRDLIILQNDETLGGEVLKKDNEFVYYRDFTDGQLTKIRKNKIKEVVLDNGEVWEFEENNETVSNETPKEIKRRKRKRLNDFEKIKVLGGGFSPRNIKFGFPKPALFGPAAFVVQGGANIQTTLGKDTKIANSRMVIPPTSLTAELGVFKNIGLGISGGVDYWREKELEYDYQHYTLGARLAWHFQLSRKMNKVDPYVGVAATHHWLFFENDPKLCENGIHPPDNRYSLVNKQWGIDFFAGIRYYWNNKWGIYGEVGSDGLSNYEIGIQRLLSKPKRGKVL